MALIDRIALGLVDGYRSNLSARKGWRCAAGVAGAATCSTAIRQSLASQGAVRSIVPAARQFASCAQAARAFRGTEVEGVCCCGPLPIPFRF